MQALLIVSAVITLWASLLWLNLPQAFRLQQRPQGLPAVRRHISLPFAPRLVFHAAALLVALAKTRLGS